MNSDGTIIYTPDPGFSGMDTFTYEISDGQGGTATATVTITVNAPPVVQNQSSTPVAILDATDDGTVVSYTIVTSPAANEGVLYLGDPNNGGVPVVAGQALTPEQARNLFFLPAVSFVGEVRFTYTATDDNGAANATPATITIPVMAPPRSC